MRSIESEGDTIDQAIERALRALDVARDQVQIEILTDATRGLLGFGGKKARVRATVRPPLASRLLGLEAEAPGKDSRETLPLGSRLLGLEAEALGKDSRETFPQAEYGQPGATAPIQPPGASHAATPSEAFQLKCKGTLEAILSRLGASCVVEAGPGSDPGSVQLAVSGDSGGLLIGRRGQTLDALEYIVNRIVGREDGVSGRVMIDVEHYRERRFEHLTQLARRLAEKAKRTGRSVTLNPMSAQERRVVHLALQNDAAISTRSQGEGHYRKVVILPAERSRRPARPKPPAS